MKKKIICFIILLTISVITVFAAPEFKMSMGFGGYFTSDFGGGGEYYNWSVRDSFYHKTPYLGGGLFSFFDLTYIEVNLGFFLADGTGASNLVTNMNMSGLYYLLYSGLDFGLTAKYPFDISNKLSIFPFLGMTYRLIFSHNCAESIFFIYPLDFSSLWFKIGFGLDYSFKNNNYLRTGISYGIRLPNEYEKNNRYMKMFEGDYRYLLGHGLEVKLAFGFGIKRKEH